MLLVLCFLALFEKIGSVHSTYLKANKQRKKILKQSNKQNVSLKEMLLREYHFTFSSLSGLGIWEQTERFECPCTKKWILLRLCSIDACLWPFTIHWAMEVNVVSDTLIKILDILKVFRNLDWLFCLFAQIAEGYCFISLPLLCRTCHLKPASLTLSLWSSVVVEMG